MISAARSITAEYAVKVSHSVARSAAAASQRVLDPPVSVAPASSRLPKLPSRSGRFCWIVSVSEPAGWTPGAAGRHDPRGHDDPHVQAAEGVAARRRAGGEDHLVREDRLAE